MPARASRGRRRLIAALAVLALAVVSIAPASALAGVSPDAPEFQELKGFLTELGFQPDTIAQIAGATSADKPADWFNPQNLSSDSVIRRPGTDIEAGVRWLTPADAC